MGDLLGYEPYLNASVPFSPGEHQVIYKNPQRHYFDFDFDNTYNSTCEYPTFWNDSGYPVLKGSDDTFDELVGCYNSEFDQVRGKGSGSGGTIGIYSGN